MAAPGRITLQGETDALVSQHRMLTGPYPDPLDWLPQGCRVEVRTTPRQTTVLVSAAPPVLPTGWTEEPVGLDEIVIAKLRSAENAAARTEGAA